MSRKGAIMASNVRMSCGHPPDCLYSDGCSWCDEVAILRRDADALRQQLDKQAFIVHGGTCYINACEIGYLQLDMGVTAYFHADPPTRVTSGTKKDVETAADA